ncbi:hypothetical protein ACF052_29515 [Streptomyces pilosus]|uniref:hypothetical protein n=1 Tax=Streptomyces pilosus TaxID=28893 RepID=UPI0036F60855
MLVVAGGTGWATARALPEDPAGRRFPGRPAHLFLGARTGGDPDDEPAPGTATAPGTPPTSAARPPGSPRFPGRLTP